MRLETPRLLIRSFEPSDAEGMLAVFGDPDVRRYLPPFPDPTIESMGKSVARRMAMERDHGHGLWAGEREGSRAQGHRRAHRRLRADARRGHRSRDRDRVPLQTDRVEPGLRDGGRDRVP